METSPFPRPEAEHKYAQPALEGLQTRKIEGLGVCRQERLTEECGVSTWRLSNIILGDPDPARFVAP